MKNILDILTENLSEPAVAELGQQIGIQDKAKTESAMDSLMKTMVAAIGKNASTPEGMMSLNNAIEKDHDGSIFDDVLGNLLGGGSSNTNSRTLNGAGILGHIFGGKQSQIFDSLSKSTGVQQNQLQSMAIKLAPFILGALGKAKNSSQGSSGLGSILDMVMGSMNSNNSQQTSFLNSILDQDGDGSIADDVAGMGMKIFGNLFRK
ncbi:DUF937 domain-containing protein [Membranihabitans marinus]|uniref:DUF937 domain-containing protein n=1 Tax=Membranihabitans marinus TaxID=1227546 RepID=UPI001F45003C|nr:DUF937 domain-containing protein [Membranihabitans marinus]